MRGERQKREQSQVRIPVQHRRMRWAAELRLRCIYTRPPRPTVQARQRRSKAAKDTAMGVAGAMEVQSGTGGTCKRNNRTGDAKARSKADAAGRAETAARKATEAGDGAHGKTQREDERREDNQGRALVCFDSSQADVTRPALPSPEGKAGVWLRQDRKARGIRDRRGSETNAPCIARARRIMSSTMKYLSLQDV
ncbi:hypothetical protein BV20DRAFT_180072 [Pilatotrama ljubarskyi]|nr:hypothetical protein BV20DRAFT_180072 [Pilatotrama ljubarskyi]